MTRLRLLILCLAVSSWAPVHGQAPSPAGYYRYPALWNDTLVFTAEGDLWRVPIAGGVAERLTSHAGSGNQRRHLAGRQARRLFRHL